VASQSWTRALPQAAAVTGLILLAAFFNCFRDVWHRHMQWSIHWWHRSAGFQVRRKRCRFTTMLQLEPQKIPGLPNRYAAASCRTVSSLAPLAGISPRPRDGAESISVRRSLQPRDTLFFAAPLSPQQRLAIWRMLHVMLAAPAMAQQLSV